MTIPWSVWTQTVLGVAQLLGPFEFSNRPAQIAIGGDKEVDLGGMDNLVSWSATGRTAVSTGAR